MRLHTDNQIDSMSMCEIFAILSKANIALDNETNGTQLWDVLRKLERTRTLAVWHDHSTLLGKGYVLITVKIVYDTIVFKTQSEVECCHEDIQAFIEAGTSHACSLLFFCRRSGSTYRRP